MSEITLDFEKPIAEMRQRLAELVEYAEANQVDMKQEIESLQGKLENTVRDIYDNLTPWQRVQLARHPGRPYMLDYVNRIFTGFMELHGDRRYSDDKAIVGGMAKFAGKPVMVIGTQKGRDMKSNMFRNFGWPHPEGYRKAMRLMELADKMGLPIITLIDTPGAFPGLASEERHIGEAIAVNLRDMFKLKVPIIAVIIGEGGSGGAIGIGVGNRILILENAYYSVITPEGCAAILWKDRKFASQAAEALKLTANDLVRLKVADRVVPEPLGGAHRNFDRAAELLAEALAEELAGLSQLDGDTLKEQRYRKFRAMGEVCERAIPEAEADPESETQPS